MSRALFHFFSYLGQPLEVLCDSQCRLPVSRSSLWGPAVRHAGLLAGSATSAKRVWARALDDDSVFKDLHQRFGSHFAAERGGFVVEAAFRVKPVCSRRPACFPTPTTPVSKLHLLSTSTSAGPLPRKSGRLDCAPKGSSRLGPFRPVPKTHGKREAPGQAPNPSWGRRTPGVLPFVFAAWRSALGFTPVGPSDEP